MFIMNLISNITNLDRTLNTQRIIMPYKKLLTIALLFLHASVSLAEEVPSWLYKAIKVSNPNELAYFIDLDKDCFSTEAELSKIVEGVLIRSRLKPIKYRVKTIEQIYLSLNITCVKINSKTSRVYSITTLFGQYTPAPAILYNYPFGSAGSGREDDFKKAFKISVEDAVTAFLKANFDL